jgi:hypothetical protein
MQAGIDVHPAGDTRTQDIVDPAGAGAISNAEIKAGLAAMLADKSDTPFALVADTAVCERIKIYHGMIRTGRRTRPAAHPRGPVP